MKNPQLEKEILELYNNTNLSSFGRVITSEKNKQLLEEIVKNTSFLSNKSKSSERLFCYINNFSSVGLCQICGKPCNFDQLPQLYNTFCSVKCQRNSQDYKDKVKISSIQKYGVEHYSNSDEVKNKKEISSINKYGVSTPLQSEEIKYKIKKTNIDRYGVENVLLNEDIKKKSKDTLLKNYGVKYTWQAKEIKEKSENKIEERYGNKVFTKTPLYLEKLRKTSLKKYGVDHYMKTNEGKINVMSSTHSRIEKSMIDKYNQILKDRGEGIEVIVKKKALGGIYIIKDIKTLEEKEIKLSNLFDRLRLGIDPNLIEYPVGSYNGSLIQKKIHDFIFEIYDGLVIQNDRQALGNGKEIDIFLPDINIGFEINGLYRHSDEFIEKSYHYEKRSSAYEKGIKLYQFYEDELDKAPYFVFNKIKTSGKMKENIDIDYLNKKYDLEIMESQIYNGRNIEVSLIDNKTAKDFLDKYHIQGADNSGSYVGVKTKEGKLVGVYSFYLMRQDKELILNRYCVAGGITFSKGIFEKALNKTMEKFKNKGIENLVSYADLRYADYTNNTYERTGFNKEGDIRNKTDYQYILNKDRFHKANFRKDKLFKLIEEINDLEGLNIKTSKLDTETSLYDKIRFSGSKIFTMKRVYNVGLVKWKKKLVF